MFTRAIDIPKERRIKNGSRGRNRAFSIAKLIVGDMDDCIVVSAKSARPGMQAPVILGMHAVDAEILACEILKLALTRGDVLHRTETIRALSMLLDKLQREDTGEFREFRPGVDRETGRDRMPGSNF